MSDLTSITASVREIVSEHMFPLKECFTAECDLYAEGLDSMALMQLILFVEQNLGVTITPEDLGRENFQTLTAIATLVEKKRSS